MRRSLILTVAVLLGLAVGARTALCEEPKRYFDGIDVDVWCMLAADPSKIEGQAMAYGYLIGVRDFMVAAKSCGIPSDMSDLIPRVELTMNRMRTAIDGFGDVPAAAALFGILRAEYCPE